MSAALSLPVTPRAKPLGPILPGQRFGRLVAVRWSGVFTGEDVWRFTCDCGAQLDRIAYLIVRAWRRGHSPSCIECERKPPRLKKFALRTERALLATSPQVGR